MSTTRRWYRGLPQWALLVTTCLACSGPSEKPEGRVEALYDHLAEAAFTDSIFSIWIDGNDGPEPGDVLLVGQSSRLLGSVKAVGRRDGRYRGTARTVAGVPLRWRSLAPDVVTVDSLGRVQALRPGRGAIEAVAFVSQADSQIAVRDTMPLRVLPADSFLSSLRVSDVSVPATSDAYQTCAVTERGQVACRRAVRSGYGYEDDHGPAAQPFILFEAPSGTRFRNVVTGMAHVCALTNQARVYCWGDNQWGQLGNGGDRPSAKPVPVSTADGFRRLSAGRTHTCGITTANRLLCWGAGTNDALGPAGTDECTIMVERRAHHRQPEPIPCARTPEAIELPDPAVDVSVGDDHTCALTTRHQLFCWGSIYNVDFASRRPKRIDDGGARLVSISSGSRHVCGLDAEGRAFCWGRNWHGQLGARTPREGSARLIAVVGAPQLRTISCGDDHTCAIGSDSGAYCWGRGFSGQLGGVVPLRDVDRPSPVSGALSWRVLSSGYAHTCGVTHDGALYCWGSGLGFRSEPGSYHKQPEPFQVAGWR